MNERRALGRCWDDVLMPFEVYERDVWELWGQYMGGVFDSAAYPFTIRGG